MPLIDRTAGILLDPHESEGIRYAVNALADDIGDACGTRAHVATRRPDHSATAIIVESAGKLAREHRLGGRLAKPESFVIRRISMDGKDAILISGAEERGTIYGIYHFSQACLGTDPLKFYTKRQPQRRERTVLNEVDHDSAESTFRWRGFHMERMNSVHGWVNGDNPQEAMFVWEKTCETLLRLRGNMIKAEPNTPQSPQVACAQRMGLMITQEHWSPLGVANHEIGLLNPDFNFCFRDNQEGFIREWEAGIHRYPRPENVIWTLGLRGKGDRPFWYDDPTAKTDAQRGAIITEAIRTQYDLVQSHFGRLNPVFIFNLWMEGVRFYREGLVKAPEGVHPVWADNGYGTFRAMLASGCEASQMCAALPDEPTGGEHGVYCHVSMYDMNAPDLGQFVPPKRIREQFAKVVEKQATAYLLVNVGRLREQVLGANAVMEIARGDGGWTEPGVQADEDYWRRWCEKYFPEVPGDVRECYDLLYNTPFKWGEWGGWDDYVVGEIGYYRRARLIVTGVLNKAMRHRWESTPFKFWNNKLMTIEEISAWFRECANGVMEKWDAAVARARAVWNTLTGTSREFFETNVLAQIEIHCHSNRYLIDMLDGVALYQAGKYADAEQKVLSALACMKGVQAAMARMSHGEWANRYKTKYWAGWEMGESTADMFLQVIQEFQLVRRG